MAVLDQAGGTPRPRWRQALISLIRALAIALAVFTLWIVACQSSLIYFPSRELDATPTDVGLEYENVSFAAADGIELHGWLVAAEDQRGAALLCHGNGGNISHRLDLIEMLTRVGLAVLAFDYRGYGLSQGSPDEEGTYLDVEAAWDQLVRTRRTPAERVVVYGRSLGGAICSRVAADHTPGALVLDSAFTSIRDAGAEIYPFLPVRLLSRYDYPTVDHVRRARCPVLVIHSRADELIPFHHGQQLFAAASEPKRFVEVEGGHNENFSASYDTYLGALRELVETEL